MKKFLAAVFCSMMLIGGLVEAATSAGGGRGGFSGGGSRSVSSAPSTRPSAPSAPSTPSTSSANPNRGSFNSQAAPKPATATPSTRTTTTTTTTTNRSYSYNSPYVGGGMMYGGLGMGFGYTNGLLTGLIIGNMMHPHNTVVYTGQGGGSAYNNNALLYPDGSVVNKQGYLVGNYVDGVFTPVQNGAMVAKPVPADANGTPIEQVQPQQVAKPVIIQNPGPTAGEIVLYVILTVGIVILFFILLGIL